MSRRYTTTGCVVTRAGLVIGGAYCPPKPAPSRDAEVIQAALLVRPKQQPPLVRRVWRWFAG